MSVPAADNLRLSAVGLLGQHLSVVADLLEAIEALHQPTRAEDGFAGEYHYCQECCMDWPCATYRLLRPPVPAEETLPNTQVQP